MGAVVLLDSRRPKPAFSAAFDVAWAAYPDQGRLRSSRAESYKAWQAILKAGAVEETALAQACQRYTREDKDHRRECGAPGFHRWLKNGRWEHWLPQASASIESDRRFPDEHVRTAVREVAGETFCYSYLDGCTVDGTTIVARTDIALRKLLELRMVFKELGFTGVRRKVE